MKNWFLEQLAMYAAYHRDPRNQATHHIGVPMIVFSLMVIAATQPIATIGGSQLTLAALLISAMVLLYLVNAPMLGMVAVLKYGILLYLAEGLAAEGMQTALISFITLFVVGWAIQFWGHAYEGRKPALFDNLTQVFMAPAFLIAEILFARGLETELKAEIEARKPRYLPDNSEADAGQPRAAD